MAVVDHAADVVWPVGGVVVAYDERGAMPLEGTGMIGEGVDKRQVLGE